LYIARAYDKPLDLETHHRVIRVKMWEMGHSFDEIDEMNVDDYGDVLGYWHENNMADEKAQKKQKALAGRGKKRRGR
jgi:hypothetical protein